LGDGVQQPALMLGGGEGEGGPLGEVRPHPAGEAARDGELGGDVEAPGEDDVVPVAAVEHRDPARGRTRPHPYQAGDLVVEGRVHHEVLELVQCGAAVALDDVRLEQDVHLGAGAEQALGEGLEPGAGAVPVVEVHIAVEQDPARHAAPSVRAAASCWRLRKRGVWGAPAAASSASVPSGSSTALERRNAEECTSGARVEGSRYAGTRCSCAQVSPSSSSRIEAGPTGDYE